MNKRSQTAPAAEPKDQKATEPAPAPVGSNAETVSAPSTPRGTEEKNGREAASQRGDADGESRALAKDSLTAETKVQQLVDKLLIEGSTFEDVVATVNQQGGPGITLNAVHTYFQGNPKLQAQRVRYLVETAESLLAGLGDLDSAEARLARAAMLTGYMGLHQDAAPVTVKDAEHARMERANLSLKHKLLAVQRDKARQALRYSEEKIRFLVVSQKKIYEQIAMLEKDAKRQQAGEPLGPAMLQRIQQIYGLTCQPMPYGGSGDAANA